MAPYNTSQAIRPLEKTVCDFAYSNGYDPMSVFNDFLRYVIHGFSPGAPPPYGLEIQTAAEQAFYGNAYRMDTAHAAGIAIRRMV